MIARRLLLLSVLLVLLIVGLLRGAPLFKPVQIGSSESTPATAQEWIDHYNCTFCHVTEEAEHRVIDDPQRNCASCHEKQGLVSLVASNFDAFGTHLRPEYLYQYLRKPGIVRHYMRDRMPDFRLGDNVARMLADHFARQARALEPLPAGVNLARQPQLHETIMTQASVTAQKHQCFNCHDFTGFVESQKIRVNPGSGLMDTRYFATDLKYARERMTPQAIYWYIMDPATVDPLSRMSALYDIQPQEAAALTYMILYAELDASAATGVPHYDFLRGGPDDEEEKPIVIPENPNFQLDVLPLLVTYCVSCHYEGESSVMGGATGYAGGFGFDAKRYSVASPGELFGKNRRNGRGEVEPLIVAGDGDSIFLKYIRGELYPAMPFGGKISPEAITIFENWIRHGAKVLDRNGKETLNYRLLPPGQEPDLEKK